MKTADILLHPVRMQIMQKLMSMDSATTAEIIMLLQDIPAPSIYRQMALLYDAGVISVVSERAIRGVIERTYSVEAKYHKVDQVYLASLTPDKLAVLYRTYLAGMSNAFEQYVDGDYDIIRDSLVFSQASFWATDNEIKEFLNDTTAAIMKLRKNTSEGRRRYTLGTIAIPDQYKKMETYE